jgi:hypothetical protein
MTKEQLETLLNSQIWDKETEAAILKAIEEASAKRSSFKRFFI